MLHVFYCLFLCSLCFSSSSGHMSVDDDHFNSSSSGDIPMESGSGSDDPTTTMPPTISTTIPTTPGPPWWFPQDCPCPYGKNIVPLVQPSPCYHQRVQYFNYPPYFEVTNLASPRECDLYTYTGMIFADLYFLYYPQTGLTLFNRYCFEVRSYSVLARYPNGKVRACMIKKF